ncbi:MAG: HEPN domain-containing protein [Lentisphaerae bacterium]|nr:HEPN domain-containing protein [Lentisphaerota bacterium]
MPPEEFQVGSPQDWLRHAHSDLVLAGMRKSKRLLYEHLCFHAQQAAEKSIKAVLVHHGIQIPRSHDLAYLMGMLPGAVRIPPSLIELPILTKYAVQQRYPGEAAPLTSKHRSAALHLAHEAVSWATRACGRKPQNR